MDARVLELADLVIRWVHVIAGIMWIGNSLLFNWLDRNLQPSSRGGAGMQGEIWLLHSGGFYYVEKTQLVGRPLPRQLHWFKWQAYTTWLSGAALLVVVYYLGGRSLLADPSVAGLAPRTAMALGAGALVVGWLSYEALWRVVAPRSQVTAGALSLGVLVAIVVVLTSLLSGRAAFLHVGAMLGTIMAANVLTTIVPSQRVLVAAADAGGMPDPAIAAGAKTRSIHNNYLTFPVVVLMLSIHFPALYGHRLNWLLLLILVAAGAAVRHVLNVRFTFPRWLPVLAATIAISFMFLYLVLGTTALRGVAADDSVAAQGPAQVSFGEARRIIDRRCASCHSREPSDVSLGVTPAGIVFDEPEQILALAARIRERAVVTRTMPPGNATRMTERERAMLGRWIDQGTTIR